jgi:hypothetical protein
MSSKVPRSVSMIWFTSSMACWTAMGPGGRGSRGGGRKASLSSRIWGGGASCISRLAGGAVSCCSAETASEADSKGAAASSGGATGPGADARGTRPRPPLRPRPPRRLRRWPCGTSDCSGAVLAGFDSWSGPIVNSKCLQPLQMQ